jgi:hypothetical protein
MIDEEDLLRTQSLANNLADTIVKAFIKRFPKNNYENSAIIINSLHNSLIYFLSHMDKHTRCTYISMLNAGLMTFNWPEDD